MNLNKKDNCFVAPLLAKTSWERFPVSSSRAH